MNDIICQNLKKAFTTEAENLEILKDVSFCINSGERVSITGSSGCGKSTLLSILGGLDRASSGKAIVGGVDLSVANEEELSSFRTSIIGFVFQFHYLLKDFTALENVMLPAYMAGLSKKEAIEMAIPLLNSVGLEKRMSHLPSKLSGGERQRVAIARAMINKPKILFADEPTGNLDQESSKTVEDILFNLSKQTGTTLLVVTHDPKMASHAERQLILTEGIITER